ncbi:hypothetical protein Q8A73_010965 [Channa argus]|nr:hypothetical protein Q8A73_010965 [Channa argus]
MSINIGWNNLSSVGFRSESTHQHPCIHMVTFWYAVTKTQVSLVQVHPTVILTCCGSPLSSQIATLSSDSGLERGRGPRMLNEARGVHISQQRPFFPGDVNL